MNDLPKQRADPVRKMLIIHRPEIPGGESHSRGIGVSPMIGQEADEDASQDQLPQIGSPAGTALLFTGRRLRPIIGKMPMPVRLRVYRISRVKVPAGHAFSRRALLPFGHAGTFP